MTLAISKPYCWIAPGQHRPRLPILMYHSISEERQRGSAYFQTVTHPAAFTQQMQVLKNEGYTGVTLADGLRWLQSSQKDIPVKPVVLTFDDGFADFFTNAVPVLNRHCFRATVYLPTGFIGRCRRRFNNRDCLTWDEIRGLHAAGFEFGSHTVTHRRLIELQWTGIRDEVANSKEEIEKHVQSSVIAFSYPYAFPQQRREFVPRFARTLTEAGYQSCVTTQIGRAGQETERLCLPRLPINSQDDASLLLAKLAGAYDWLAPVQALLKRAKSSVDR